MLVNFLAFCLLLFVCIFYDFFLLSNSLVQFRPNVLFQTQCMQLDLSADDKIRHLLAARIKGGHLVFSVESQKGNRGLED